MTVQRLDAIADVGQPAGTGAVRLEPQTVVFADDGLRAERLIAPRT